ncbi:MAG: methionyl-tRNA formyltransferase [Gammaproteobacteria bacterium RBG_16_66_13]|nr:MAG: methionyl-tRNA formyltransferase [Gammaproteobacteria bacterium RBG_16_66_13]
MRLVFLGSPEFAVPSLEALAAHYRVAGVVTQPDRPAGRGRRLRPPAVRLAAARLGLQVIQPRRVSDAEALEAIRKWAPEAIVVVAFGQLLRPSILDLPRWGCLNVHASLLPRWRGASPIQATILEGDPTTGVTVMKMDAGLDTGPILAQRSVPIAPDETGGSLSTRLSSLGAALLLETLPGLQAGSIKPTPQQEEQATHAPLLRKSDGALDPTEPAERLARKVRAYHPWPGTFLNLDRSRLGVLSAHAAPALRDVPVGQVVQLERAPAVSTVQGYLVLDRVQPEGKKPMTGAAFLLGSRDFVGTTLRSPL